MRGGGCDVSDIMKKAKMMKKEHCHDCLSGAPLNEPKGTRDTIIIIIVMYDVHYS